jgi:hypothetical protein
MDRLYGSALDRGFELLQSEALSFSQFLGFFGNDRGYREESSSVRQRGLGSSVAYAEMPVC